MSRPGTTPREESKWTPRADMKVLNTDLLRVDGKWKVAGAAVYAHDQRLPGRARADAGVAVTAVRQPDWKDVGHLHCAGASDPPRRKVITNTLTASTVTREAPGSFLSKSSKNLGNCAHSKEGLGFGLCFDFACFDPIAGLGGCIHPLSIA